MTAWEWKKHVVASGRPGRLMAAAAAALWIGSAAWASDTGTLPSQGHAVPAQPTALWPTYVIPGQPEVSTLYADGNRIVVDTDERWRLMCNSNPNGISSDDLRRFAEQHEAAMAAGPVWAIENPDRDRTNINIVYHVDASVPPAAAAALAVGEAYIETLFANSITVDIYVSFADMGGGGVIGATSSSYVNGVSYTNSRNGLINGMDSNDVLQTWLPLGSTCPVRFDGTSSTVTQVSTVSWTRANYRATVGTTSGSAANMTFNTEMAFDYDPSNGINAGTLSFVDVLIHETGHALGFVSAVDSGSGIQALDLFRFQRTDGGFDYNPDTYAEFQTQARLVSYNSPDDDHNSDIIVAEYRMEDGNPYQGSHFRDQAGSSWIGLMDPTLADEETHYPDYYSVADKNMFDAIGYKYPPCTVPHFTQQPTYQEGCVGGSVQVTVAVDTPVPAYQWRIGTTNLVNDGIHILGATTATLTIANLTLSDINDQYNCFVTNTADGCTETSNYSTVYVYSLVSFTSQPTNQTINEGATVAFFVSATGQAPLSYQWRHDGANITNGGNISGATSASLLIMSAQAPQAGYYDCVVSDRCGPVASNAAHLIINTGYGAGRGDLNCDGSVNFRDINPFVLALSAGEAGYYDVYGDCHWYNGDVNSDGTVGFSDINPFVALLSGGG